MEGMNEEEENVQMEDKSTDRERKKHGRRAWGDTWMDSDIVYTCLENALHLYYESKVKIL